MKNEVRGLQAGDYWSKDETLLLRVRRTDSGVSIEIADMDADIYYGVNVDENRKTKFEWGNVTPTSNNEEKGNNDAAD